MKKFALYARVSTGSQDTMNQEIRLVEYAKEKGLEFDIYSEVQSSRKSRPIKQELMAKIRTGQYAGIIVYRLDRFARSSYLN